MDVAVEADMERRSIEVASLPFEVAVVCKSTDSASDERRRRRTLRSDVENLETLESL